MVDFHKIRKLLCYFFSQVHVENPIQNDIGDLDLLYYASEISKPNLDRFSVKKEQNESVEMTTDNGLAATHGFAPGEIILYRKSTATDVAMPDETPDEGEIDDDIQVVKEDEKGVGNGVAQFVDDKFVEINKDKGDIVFLSVTNTGSQRIRVKINSFLLALLF